MNYAILPLQYRIVYENGEKSDIFEWEATLSREDEKIYESAFINGIRLSDVPALEKVKQTALQSITEGGLEDFIICDCPYKVEIDFAV